MKKPNRGWAWVSIEEIYVAFRGPCATKKLMNYDINRRSEIHEWIRLRSGLPRTGWFIHFDLARTLHFEEVKAPNQAVTSN